MRATTYFFLSRVLFCCLFVFSYYIKLNVLNTVAGCFTFELVFSPRVVAPDTDSTDCFCAFYCNKANNTAR